MRLVNDADTIKPLFVEFTEAAGELLDVIRKEVEENEDAVSNSIWIAYLKAEAKFTEMSEALEGELQ